jgi:hypothetical protein
VACKESILALQGDGADRALDGIAIHLNPAIGEKQDQAVLYRPRENLLTMLQGGKRSDE